MRSCAFLLFALSLSSSCFAQGVDLRKLYNLYVHLPKLVATTDALADKDGLHANTYADLSVLILDHTDLRLRYEHMTRPLPGFDSNFAGHGFAHVSLSQSVNEKFSYVLGDVYEQFGSGAALRLYEDRTLGIDGSLRGGEMTLELTNFELKALAGRQRCYWKHNKSVVWGAEVSCPITDVLGSETTSVSVSGFYVGRRERSQEDIMVSTNERLRLPTLLAHFGGQVSINSSGFAAQLEGVVRSQDPSRDNNYTYGRGNCFSAWVSLSKSGRSLVFQARRNYNMSVRSRRSDTGNASMLNHLPPFSMQHTASLMALRPYATQTLGEWAFQVEARRKMTKDCRLDIHFSHIRGLLGKEGGGEPLGSDGLKPSVFKTRELYFQDFNVRLAKMVEQMTFDVMYSYQKYAQATIENHGEPMIDSHIVLLEGCFPLSSVLTLRTELQGLMASCGGNWLAALVELSVAPKIMFSAQDMWNASGTEGNFYRVGIAYTGLLGRLAAGYGKTRAGYNCSGGVCRFVPQTEGAYIQMTFNP